MRCSTGRWVSGGDFFGRERELSLLETRIQDGNHVLLTGQRRMGKTSIAQELGRRLEEQGWVFAFADVEAATCAEDAVTEIARSIHPIRSRLARGPGEYLRSFLGSIEEVGVRGSGVRYRALLNAGNWRRHGDELIRTCARHERPIFLVVDELPIFLKRMLGRQDGARQVDEFLSWLRQALQSRPNHAPAVMVSGSIGLMPLATRLGMTDRISYLEPVRLGPWDRKTSIACVERLAASYNLAIDNDVPGAIFDALGIGIPHHVQSFFARLKDFALMQARERVTARDVGDVYRTALLGPSGQNDLIHYETRLRDALDDESHSLAMEILAEAALHDVFTMEARHTLEQLYTPLRDDTPARIAEALDVLEHDGYLEPLTGGHRFQSQLLKDWWAARFRDHYTPLSERSANRKSKG